MRVQNIPRGIGKGSPGLPRHEEATSKEDRARHSGYESKPGSGCKDAGDETQWKSGQPQASHRGEGPLIVPDIISDFAEVTQTGWFVAVLAYHLLVGYWGMRFLREERDEQRKALRESREQFIAYMEKRNSAVEKELQQITTNEAIVAERLAEHAKLLERMDQRGDMVLRKIMGA